MKRIVAIIVAFVMLVLSSCFVGFTDNLFYGDNIRKIDSHLCEKREPVNKDMTDYALTLFQKVYDTYISYDNNCYFALIPDKYFILTENQSEYDNLYYYMTSGMLYAESIDVYDLIEKDDYYFTDMHLRQEESVDIAQRLLSSMNNTEIVSAKAVKYDGEFLGNYAYRTSKKVKSEEFFYLTNDTIENLYTKEDISIYDFSKLSTKESYEFFLSGNQSIVTIKNDNAEKSERLIVFRDSFASSLAPLLCESYSEVVLVDMRYIMSDLIGEYVDFEKADILFLYSTPMINGSLAMK